MQHRAEDLARRGRRSRRRGSRSGRRSGPPAGASSCFEQAARGAGRSIWASIPACASASITGPMSVESSQGSPRRSSSMAPNSIFSTRLGDVLLHVEHAQRRAALAGALEGRGDDVAHRLLGQRGRVDDHGVEAAGLGDQRRAAGRDASAIARLISCAVSVEPVKQTPADARVGGQRARRPRPVAGQQLERRRGDAGLVHQRAPRGRRSAASARRAWRAPHCRRPAPPRSGR